MLSLCGSGGRDSFKYRTCFVKRFLIDENLPFVLGHRLGVDYVHATEVESQASDSILWDYAKRHDLFVITRDTDFFDRLLLYGPPPKVVWVRLGNLRKQDLIRALEDRWLNIQMRLEGADLIEVHPDRLEALTFFS